MIASSFVKICLLCADLSMKIYLVRVVESCVI